ncbi:hypothetical protein ABEF95_014319 [Exophiala dermatitidis]
MRPSRASTSSSMSQPCSSSSQASVGVEDFPYQYSSPLSLRQQSYSSPPAPSAANHRPTHDYNFLGCVYDESTSGTETEDAPRDEESREEEDALDDDRRISGCSSISSFPASVSQYLPSKQEQYGSPKTPTRHKEGPPLQVASSTSAKKYNSPFRHPSSVKALQMRDEIMSETNSVLRHPRHSSSQKSSCSRRTSFSPMISASKRSVKSSRGTPIKLLNSNLRTEFPLVLLHCTLLPPTLLPQSTTDEDFLIAEFLPELYRKRFETLRDKLVVDVEVRTRGILIPHPKEDYELLEERLLESLQLEKPRIRHSHYFNADADNTDSGFESGSLTEDDGDERCPHSTCPDCGQSVVAAEINPRWDIKVFAANGLMRAGAWAAAWQEMEKVDVEIRVWLPGDLRRELEAKLAVVRGSVSEEPTVQLPTGDHGQNDQDAREREVYGEAGRQSSLADFEDFDRTKESTATAAIVPEAAPAMADLGEVVSRYARRFLHDSRNVLVLLLALIITFLAFAGKKSQVNQSPSPLAFPPSQLPQVVTTTVITTSIAVSTATVTASLISEVPCVASGGGLAPSTTESATVGKRQEVQIDSEPARTAATEHTSLMTTYETPSVPPDLGSS